MTHPEQDTELPEDPDLQTAVQTTEAVTGEAAVENAVPEPKLQASEEDLENRSVLVLEDDPVQVKLLCKHLESLQMRVTHVDTIAGAKAALESEIPNLAIFDVRLPDGSGLDLCQELDAQPRFADLPIIVLSSMTSDDMVRRSRASGARYFLGKPYDPNILLLLIRQLIGEG